MMKKLLFSAFALGLANLCSAQTTVKKEEVKFTPPVIVKDEIKFAAPIIKKNKAVKKIRKVKSVRPVVVKDVPIN